MVFSHSYHLHHFSWWLWWPVLVDTASACKSRRAATDTRTSPLFLPAFSLGSAKARRKWSCCHQHASPGPSTSSYVASHAEICKSEKGSLTWQWQWGFLSHATGERRDPQFIYSWACLKGIFRIWSLWILKQIRWHIHVPIIKIEYKILVHVYWIEITYISQHIIHTSCMNGSLCSQPICELLTSMLAENPLESKVSSSSSSSPSMS